MRNVFEVLKERGFIEQMTHPEQLENLLANERVSFYIGFDPTADSLHVGHFMTVMAMAHMQRAGHRPICLVGGGTGMIGDPTDKSDMRRVMTREEVAHNVSCFKKQLSKFIDFEDDKALMVDNGDWLLNLNYIDFIREYGVHFTVNRMLAAECYKQRYEKGLTFLEFNYMIMQSYDFLELNRRVGCKLQLGGNDQWSNIIGGVELIRRVESRDAYGMTFTLLTTSENKKMGKTESGAVWLDPEKTSPYEFFQYWRNVADADVRKCLCLLTFLPMAEVERLSSLEGSEINKAKEILAFELTKIVHGEEEATKALEAAKTLFAGGASLDNIPSADISKEEIGDGIIVVDLLEKLKLISSKSEGRRLIEQNGVSIDGEKVKAFSDIITVENFKDNSIMIQKGKKVYLKVNLV